MVNKLLGYILALVGLLALAYDRVPQLQQFLPFLAEQPKNYLTIGGVILVVLGLFFVLSGGRRGHRTGREVPIYHGRNLVGYRKG